MIGKLAHRARAAIRLLGRSAALTLTAVALATVTAITAYHLQGSDETYRAAWGSSVVEKHDEAAPAADLADSVIPPANACGLGASSCYDCHGGVRAEFDEDTAWHDDHADVNHSCEGCHAGNPRMMMDDMAHDGMREIPVDDIEASCADCHDDDELEAYRGQY